MIVTVDTGLAASSAEVSRSAASSSCSAAASTAPSCPSRARSEQGRQRLPGRAHRVEQVAEGRARQHA